MSWLPESNPLLTTLRFREPQAACAQGTTSVRVPSDQTQRLPRFGQHQPMSREAAERATQSKPATSSLGCYTYVVLTACMAYTCDLHPDRSTSSCASAEGSADLRQKRHLRHCAQCSGVRVFHLPSKKLLFPCTRSRPVVAELGNALSFGKRERLSTGQPKTP